VSNIRGEGLMCAMDLSNDLQKKFVSRCYENGLFILKCGTNSIRFRTQLGINSSEIEEGFEIITKSLKQLI
jgi:L-lysine 6-transaminase